MVDAKVLYVCVTKRTGDSDVTPEEPKAAAGRKLATTNSMSAPADLMQLDHANFIIHFHM